MPLFLLKLEKILSVNGGVKVDYKFFFTKTASVNISNAPRLADADLITIARLMERNGRYYGSNIQIHAIGIRSDYLAPTTPMRMSHLTGEKNRGDGR